MSDIGPSEFHTQRLTVDAGNPGIRIDVLDHAYQLKARGFGRLERELPTGLYTLRYAAADAREERGIVLLPDDPVVIDDPPNLAFASAAPLDGTSLSHEYHQDAAQHLSIAEKSTLGDGAEFFLFARDVDPGGTGNPAAGLTLHRLDGGVVADLPELAKPGPNRGLALSAGRTLRLDPGSYRLRVAIDSDRSVEMVVQLARDWQTQIFLLRETGAYAADRPLANLAGATLLMTRPGLGFEPRRRVSSRLDPFEAAEDLRLAELARHALAEGRQVPERELHALLNGKWVDPLLGIFGVHLLLMRSEPDLAFADTVIGRLREIVDYAPFPDIEALALEVARRRGHPLEARPFEAPPMLWRAWEMLIRESSWQPHLIGQGTLPDAITDRLWGAAAWLVWETPATTTERAESVSAESSRAEQDRAFIGAFEAVARSRSLFAILRRSSIQDYLSTLDRPNLLPLASDVAEQLRKFPGVSPGLSELGVSFQTILPELDRRLDTLSAGLTCDAFVKEARLNQSEQALLVYILGRLMLVRAGWTATPLQDLLTFEVLVQQINLPAARVARTVAGLVTKLAIYFALERLEAEATSRGATDSQGSTQNAAG